MSWSWRREGPQLAILLAMFLAAAFAWGRVDEPIPVHWNIQGEVDGYGGKFEGLLLVPLISVGLYLLLLVIPRIDPGRANYASFAGTYALIRGTVLIYLAAIHALLLTTAFGHQAPVGALIPAGAGLMLVVLGNVMGKIRPNFFAGIRTPWTLSSERSWTATHRVGGRAMVAGGVLIAVMGFVQQVWYVIAALSATGLGLAWVVYYSYRVWRDDPERIPVTGTLPAEGDSDANGEG